MRTKIFALLALIGILLTACGPAAVSTPVVVTQQVVQTQIVEVTPTPGPNPEAVIQNVEPNATITFWTYYLSPTFDDYIKSTIARFQATYPGVTVKWEDHQATFQQDLNNAFAAGNAPDVINLSVGEGWVSDYATQGLLLSLDDKVPQSVQALYFPGLWKEQLVKGVNYQFPWYQSIPVELINTQIYTGTPQTDASGNVTYTGGAGLKVSDFPKTIDGLPALCQTIKQKTGTLCDIRLSVNDLLSQMVYEGNVKVISDDGKQFTFNSPAAVSWLQMYVDMVKAGTVDKTVLVSDQDRVGLDLFE
ncbi:MAG TPA: extracellular solute-binding protein, partial [Anaerolineales bacterium]